MRSSGVIFVCFALLRVSLTESRCGKCPPGWGVSKVCSAGEDTVCERCITGRTYSPRSSRTSPCWQCSRCGFGLYEARGCSLEGDTVCDDCTALFDNPGSMRNDDFRDKCHYLYADLGRSRLKASHLERSKPIGLRRHFKG